MFTHTVRNITEILLNLATYKDTYLTAYTDLRKFLYRQFTSSGHQK